MSFRNLPADGRVLAKVGISSVDEEGARLNVEAEIPNWDFEGVMKQANTTWNEALGKIDIETSDNDSRTVFYTSLYHAFIQPSLASDVDGRYRTMGHEIKQDASYTNYTVFSLWDTFRAAHPLYTIVTPEQNQAFIRSLLRKYDEVDAYEDNDMLKGLLAKLDEEGNTKEGGIQVEAAVLMPAYMKNDDQKAIFANAKVNDVLVFNPNVAYDGHAAELGSLLKIDKEIAKDVKSDFSFQVEEITRFVPGELTQEVFDQAFGEGVVKTEEEFRAKIKEEIAARFVADSDYKFLIDIRKVMMEKVGKLEFSDALLKRIMLLNNEEKGEEYVAENYDKSIEELTWHLIKEQLVEANDIKVEQEDVLKMARETTKAQFAQYGMLSIPDDVLDNYAQEMLKKKETINNLVSRVVEVKLAAALKAQVTLENKNVSIEEFNKMFE